MNRQRGFTLMEGILVIVIGAVLASLAIPRLQGIGAFRLNAAARKLQSDLRYAQQLAMSRGTVHKVAFSPGQNRYRVVDTSTGRNATDPFTGDPGVAGKPWNSGLVVDYDTDPELIGVDLVSLSFGFQQDLLLSDEVYFDPLLGRATPQLGAFSPGTMLTVTLAYQGETKTVTIAAESGQVYVP